MAAPLDGIKVLEVANWLAAPAAAALMADLGAEVVKIEPPTGDVFRGFILRSIGYDFDFPTNYGFEVDNRGKRSVVVDLDKPGGAELVRRLAADSDIFITNLVQRRRTRYGLAFEDIIAVNPKVIYASFSGYGASGPDEDRPGFDFAAFWAVLIALLNYIPYIGSMAGVLAPTAIAIVQFEGDWSMIATCFFGLTFCQIFVGSFLEPSLMGRSLNLSPFVILVSLTAWGSMWGIAGALLSAPVTAILVIVFSEFEGTRPVAILLSRSGKIPPQRHHAPLRAANDEDA